MEFSIRRQLCSHLVEVDKVDIERLVSLARLQQILVLVRVLRRKDETDDNLDDGIIAEMRLSPELCKHASAGQRLPVAVGLFLAVVASSARPW